MLQIWLSPSFPVGAYAYSHGLEMAAEQGLVRDHATLSAWLENLIEFGSLRSDLILAAQAIRAVASGEWSRLGEIAELGAALQPSSERYLEATQQGRSFFEQVASAWPSPLLAEALTELRRGSSEIVVTYPVAFGLAAGAHGIPAVPALTAYGIAFIGNLASASIRLSLIGQSEGQRLIAGLCAAVAAAASRAEAARLEDLGTVTFRADLVSMQHERQYTRLFRS
ncbi:MAG: urease accessory protein UreF [Hyphomicrobiaceae bacterium]|nr:MAG: urease accessory protein UreF [Hyphomicrobiaceae bacterium]